jgi:hypothetical protein
MAYAQANFISFDVPGAGTGDSEGTYPASINSTRAGSYADSTFVYHGFARAANGSIVRFQAPEAAIRTFTSSIDMTGAIRFYLKLALSVTVWCARLRALSPRLTDLALVAKARWLRGFLGIP